MPNEFSNFSMPDTGSSSGGYQAPPDPSNVGSNGYVWDPGTKSWVKAGSGQTAGNASTTGMPAPGVNGLMPIREYDPAAEAARYQSMAANPTYTSGPAIDRSVSNESRGISLDALGQLRARAEGAMTPAQALARQQTQGAVNGITSGAASIKGGAAARAAAARGATALGARVGAQGAQDEQALRAREMADASGQYFGASSAQRDRDLNQATDQAKLDAAQRVANEQRSENYENLGYGTKVENVNHTRGASAEAATASNASRAAGLAEDAASFGKMKDVAGAAIGATSGAVQGYGASRQPEKSSDPWDPRNYSGSDPKMKRGISPIGKGHEGKTKEPVSSYVGKYLSTPFPTAPDVISGAEGYRSAMPDVSAPSRFTVEQLAGDRSGADPYRTPEPEAPKGESLFGGRIGETAVKGYASQRAGHEGAMFGASPTADYTNQLWGDEANAHRKVPQYAPGTGDFYAGKEGRAARDRDVALSDPRAKEAAWDEGHNEALRKVQEMRYMPAADLKKLRAKGNRIAEAVSGARADAYDEGRGDAGGAEPAVRIAPATRGHVPYQSLPDPAPPPNPLDVAAQNFRDIQGQVEGTDGENVPGQFAAGVASQFGAPPKKKVAPPPPAPKPAAVAMLSDPRTKEGARDNPMAEANRSMAPSSYAYKPEYTPPEQETGEMNVGPMADKMEADPVAKTAIVKDPETGLLAIDKTKGLKLVMGGLADLQAQVDAMKVKRKA